MNKFLTAVCIFSLTSSLAVAQPDADELASQIEAAQAAHLADINGLTVRTEMSTPMGDMPSTTRYVKEMKNGQPVLRAVDDDEMNVAGMHDDMLAKLTRHASSIQSVRHGGREVFKITVDDADFLRSMEELHMGDEMMEDDLDPKEAIAWISADDYTVQRMRFVQVGPQGGDVTIDIDFSDYRVHRGLPIAHHMKLSISGIDQMMSSEDAAMARAQMEQLKAQLEHMPEAQRAMIEEQLAPQIAQFEQMMSSGGTDMEIRVVDVTVE